MTLTSECDLDNVNCYMLVRHAADTLNCLHGSNGKLQHRNSIKALLYL